MIKPDDLELVNSGFSRLEGKNIIDVENVFGKKVVREEIAAAFEEGRSRVDLYG